MEALELLNPTMALPQQLVVIHILLTLLLFLLKVLELVILMVD